MAKKPEVYTSPQLRAVAHAIWANMDSNDPDAPFSLERMASAAIEAYEKAAGWDFLISLGEKILVEHYPSDIFRGSSEDASPVYISALRTTLENLRRKLDANR